MAHIRTQAAQALMTALAGISAPVYRERNIRLGKADMPFVVLSMTDDEVQEDQGSMGDPVYQRVQAVVFQIHDAKPEGDALADSFDQIELEIEAAVSADASLGGLVEDIWPGTSELETDATPDTVTGVRTLTYRMIYRAAYGSPDTPAL